MVKTLVRIPYLTKVAVFFVKLFFREGGPLMIRDTEDDLGSYYVAGVVSFGPADCDTENIPGVYTKVADYLEWILDTITS